MPTSKKNESVKYAPITQVQENATSIKLIQQTLEYMSSGIDEIKTGIDNLRKEFKAGYATKDELKLLKNEVADLKSDISTINNVSGWATKLVFSVIIIALLGLIMKDGVK